jgi:hypothetical protein
MDVGRLDNQRAGVWVFLFRIATAHGNGKI